MRWLLTRGRTRCDASGRVLERAGICLDITERHEAEALNQARDLAEQASAAKTQFLARMSHELRTPLNAVLGFAQLLALDAAQPLNDIQAARVAHIQTAGWHLLALIDDVLDLTRIESQQARLEPTLVPVAEVVAECLAMNANAAARQGITLRDASPGDAPARVWADPRRLKQVLLNLLSNAVKYNRDGGLVTVLARPHSPAQVGISVSDTGMGMSPAQLERLFQPFNRLGRESGPVEGAGIGLALSRLIAKQMGGTLEARSSEGQGTEFCLVLPAAPPASCA